MLTLAQLRAIFPRAADDWAPAIGDAWLKFGFVTASAQAGYCGIVGNESGGLTSVHRELMTHTLVQAMALWKRARNDPETCKAKIAAGPQAFANWIYAGVLGNGNEASGDGWAYRGGGIIQLTGRDNYAWASRELGVDLIADPDSLTSTPARSAAAAAAFMAKRVKILPLLDDGSEAAFLEGAEKVGSTDGTATQRRLTYRAAALHVLAARPSGDPPPIDREVIRRIQVALNRRGAAPQLAEDGIWGPKTGAAADAYRAAHGLKAHDGPDVALAKALGIF